MDDFFNQA
jgi:hypothetical protein